MSTPQENFELATDDATDPEERERAIADLETANECDSLAELVGADDIAMRFRERALDGLDHPQCSSTLEELADDESLSESMRDRAREMLGETPEDAGAGP